MNTNLSTLARILGSSVSIVMALAVMTHSAQAQDIAGASRSTTSEVSRFVQDPFNCKLMMGGDDGDLLPAAYSVALDASLNEIGAPSEQAITQIYARCAQRVSALSGPVLN